MDALKIKHLIESQLENTTANIESDGKHVNASVIGDIFLKKNRLARHKLVLQCVQQALDSGELHAISIKTFTIEEKKIEEQSRG